ncbi:carbohydrate sulfotransferase 5-like isoform X2 [Mytilus californianus]|uniref:carbohydrate sulfotransferase 5-like isoform X2 n=1 Tax=Mytilus californianus TaxID=6549 RepID=UPI0022467FB8|nr:carbohydrate sulfotransferase 5-like isoform X2 [Mytilus californianus]
MANIRGIYLYIKRRTRFMWTCVAIVIIIFMDVLVDRNKTYRQIQHTLHNFSGKDTKEDSVKEQTRHDFSKQDQKRHLVKDTAAHDNFVLIVGYFRGGSTMTLDVLSTTENSFYVFEPINFLSFDTYENTAITFLNGSSRLLDKIMELPAVQADMLANWFNCRLSDINLSDLRSSNLQYHSRMTREYYQCQRRSNISSCIGHLVEVCKQMKNKILKVVRLRMETTELLLNTLPNLKIIHLVRDPRGILNSLMRAKLIGVNDFKSKASEICNDILSDIKSTTKLKTLYPNTIFLLKYEALVKNPTAVFKRIFNFTNLSYSQKVEMFIQSHLLGHSSGGSNAFLTKSGNANMIASNWRKTIKPDEVIEINKLCHTVFETLGYQEVNHKTLQDRNESLQRVPSLKHIFDEY